MNEVLRVRLAANGGVVDASELAQAGYDRHATRALVARGELHRVRAGAFVDGAAFRVAGPAERHTLTARAVVRRLDGYAVSHLSAVVLWGLPVATEDPGAARLDVVHVSRIGAGRARLAGAVRVHPAVGSEDVVRHRGVPVVTVAAAILQTAATSMRAGLIAADAAVREGLVSRDALVDLAERRGLGFAPQRVACLASGLSESAGESWTRLVLSGLGWEPEQQVEIRDGDGRFVARVDFLLRSERVVIEFDGAVKYDGAEGRLALVREKHREDALRALGYRVVRLTWADLRRPERVASLLRAALAA